MKILNINVLSSNIVISKKKKYLTMNNQDSTLNNNDNTLRHTRLAL